MEFNANLTIEEWTGNNDLAISIFNNKYRYGDETFMESIDRISGGNEEIKQLILEKKFLPGGRIMSNRGLYKNGKKVSLSNCYVMPPIEDNLESIFDTAKMMARTFSYGGGVGVDLSKLAFRGAKVRNAAESSSGAVSFMELYSHVTGLISQNGRRGATMLSMDVTHPDIEEFIQIKQDLDKVTKANISVKITDEFMRAVKNDEDFELKFQREETGEEKIKIVKAKELFRLICECAWNTGEPGVLFWDRIKNYNLLSEDGDYELAGTNPCSEIPLPAGGACLLGSINLSAFVDKPFTNEAKFMRDEFINTVSICVRELDLLLDEGLEGHPLEIQKETAKAWRAIGLGIMGLSDLLIKMGIRYGSNEAIKLCDKIGKIMAQTAILASCQNGVRLGTFPKLKQDKVRKSEFFKNNAPMILQTLKHGTVSLRNGQLLTIAPTGSLSNVLGISGGIEPIFANSYTRKTQTLHEEETFYKIYTPIVKEYMEKFGIEDEKDLPDYFVTAPEIPYEERIKMQAVWQKHIDNSISSTVNLPESSTVEDIEDIYMKAWENGLKGITVFRDNCKRVGILTTNKKEETTNSVESSDINRNGTWASQVKEEIEKSINEETTVGSKISDAWDFIKKGYIRGEESETIGPGRGEVIKVTDKDIHGLKRKLITGCGSLHCEAFFDKNTGQLVETFLSKGSTGGCNNFMVGLSRFISMAARLGASIDDIVDQLKSTGSCPSYATRRAIHGDTSKGSCCPMAVGNALLDMYEEFNKLGKYAEKETTVNVDKEWLIKLLSTVDVPDKYKTLMPVNPSKPLVETDNKIEENNIFNTGEVKPNGDVEFENDNGDKITISKENFQNLADHCNSSEDLINTINIIYGIKKRIETNETKFNFREEALCPQCGSKLDHEGGCDICRDCGWTRCD